VAPVAPVGRGDGAGTRVAVLAGLTALLLAAAGGCWLGLRAAEPDAAIPSPTEVVDDTVLLTSSTAVLTRLGDERDDAVTRLNSSQSSRADPGLRGGTDDVVLTFQVRATERGGDVLHAYGPAIDALNHLPGLRAEVDGELAEEGPADAGAAAERAATAFFAYSRTIAAVNDGNLAAVAASDPPSDEAGRVLQAQVLAQTATAADLERALALAALSGGLDQPFEVDGVTALLADLEDRAAAIEAVDAGPFRDVVERRFPDALQERLVRQARAALAGGLPAELDASPGEGGYDDLGAGIDDLLGRRAERREGATTSDPRRPWRIGLAATAGLAAAGLLALVVVVVVTVRSRRAADRLPDADLAAILAIPSRRSRRSPPAEPGRRGGTPPRR